MTSGSRIWTSLSGKASQSAEPTMWFMSMLCTGYVVELRRACTLKVEKSPASRSARMAAALYSPSSSPHL